MRQSAVTPLRKKKEGAKRPCAHSSGAKAAVMTKWEFLQTELATLARDGLLSHPRTGEAAHGAIERFGVGPAAVRSIVGTLSLHHELEQKLAAFKGVEATL